MSIGESACLVRPYVDCKSIVASVLHSNLKYLKVMTESELRVFFSTFLLFRG